jgi:hypothetical protein
MNYTQKNSINTNLSHKNINIDLKNDSNAYSVIEPEKVSPLGNREIDWQQSKLYQKFNRKHIAQYALTVGNITDNELEKRRQKKHLKIAEFKLKLKNDKSIKKINQSLCSCGRDIHYMNEDKIVDLKEFEHNKRFQGLKSCGNNAACPECAAKLSAIRGNQLKEMMEAGRLNGRCYIQVVTTIPHKSIEFLDTTLNQVIDMSSYIFQDREYRIFKEKTKCRFVHGGLENMVSFKNGLVDWHPHKNYLLDFDITISEILNILGLNTELELRMYISEMMTRLSQKYLDKEGIKKTLLVPRYELNTKTNKIDVKAGVVATLDFKDDYIAKWGLDAEMTASIYKSGRYDGSIDEDGNYKKSFHPFGLLDLIDENNKETNENFKYQCIKAFQEFVLVSKGKWWFYFARDSVSYYNENYGTELKVKKDEEELLALDDLGDLIFTLSEEEWFYLQINPRKMGFIYTIKTKLEVINYMFEEIEKNRIKVAEKYNCKISTYLKKRKKE